MNAVYGLVGKTLKHSFSQKLFNKIFADNKIVAEYHLYEFSQLDIVSFRNFLADNEAVVGLNVTIPYKKIIISVLDGISDDAAEIGAVNCLKIMRNPLNIIGFNTDWSAFEQSFTPLLQPYHCKALILGTGGVSKAVSYALDKLNIPYLLVSRSRRKGSICYDELNELNFNDYNIIINATPCGMTGFTNELETLFPFDKIVQGTLMYDLVYNPDVTFFMLEGMKRRCIVKNGLEMLNLQALGSWKIWNG